MPGHASDTTGNHQCKDVSLTIDTNISHRYVDTSTTTDRTNMDWDDATQQNPQLL